MKQADCGEGTPRPLVLKFGGELLEDPAHLSTAATAVRAVSAATPLAIVHGGGREIDAALGAAGIEKRQVDGLRITDVATLEIVVSVLAGAVNTRFVAVLNASGVPAVGLTGADGRCGLAQPAPPHRAVDGRLVDLGRVGIPVPEADARIVERLIAERFVPVIASIGIDRDGRLLNVNADTFAGHLAVSVGARRLVVAGATPGVLDENGRTIPSLDAGDLEELVDSQTATAGMIAKLRACAHALAEGVEDVIIVDGRNGDALEAAATATSPAAATRITASARTLA